MLIVKRKKEILIKIYEKQSNNNNKFSAQIFSLNLITFACHRNQLHQRKIALFEFH